MIKMILFLNFLRVFRSLDSFDTLVLNRFFLKHSALSLHKKSSFPLRISSVNVTKSAGNCGFGHIY